ncbi:CsbD family protein [Actinomadura sp. J1-007]|nr:CsbD family protein [Actinomadura sp. J1-007]
MNRMAAKAKEAAGKAKGDDELQGEAKADQAKSEARETAGDVKDEASGLAGKARGAFKS